MQKTIIFTTRYPLLEGEKQKITDCIQEAIKIPFNDLPIYVNHGQKITRDIVRLRLQGTNFQNCDGSVEFETSG